FRRLMFPYFLGASVIFLLSFVLGSFIIPKSSKVKLAFEEKYYKNANIGNQKNIHKQVSPGVYIYLQSFDGRRDTGQGFSIEKFDNGELISKLVAVSIRWDSINNNWRLLDYYIRNIDGMHEEIITGREIDSTMNFTPDEFRRRANVVESMTTPELNRFIESEISRGSDNIETYKIEKYRRLSSPFAVFILTLIGVSLSSRKVKGGLGLNIGFGLLLSFSYILFMRVSKVFSVSGDLDPLIAVWIPNIVFTCIAIILYITTPK
ncbi:LptF/LptG family permease, partial [Bacteroidota bacterium]